MKKCLLFIMLGFSCMLHAQLKDTLPNFNDDYFLVKDGDSLMIRLNEVTVFSKRKFKSRIDLNYYYWFKKKVFKAYPYAVLASKRLDSLNARLGKIESKRKKRKYVRNIQKYLEEELTDQIKQMTKTEGRILIKLVHRQTGKTVFQNIKELRSGWKAFWYNTTANIFSLSLKDKYRPDIDNEDYLIEDVLQRGLIDETIEWQIPKLKIDAYTILEANKREVNFDRYKKMFAKLKKKREKKNQEKSIKNKK